MAEILEEWPEGAKPPGRPPVYPWDEWLDGKIRKLTRGTDFAALVPTMRQQLKAHARAKGGSARVSVVEKDKALVVQFLPGESSD